MNASIAKMIQLPGRYGITTPTEWLRGRYFSVEVDGKGVVHQLDPQGNRDGVLSNDGWGAYVIVMDARCLP
jgi:hypothetical protein